MLDCKERVCEQLQIDVDDVKLSMGMSNDYQQAVCFSPFSFEYFLIQGEFMFNNKLVVNIKCRVSSTRLFHDNCFYLCYKNKFNWRFYLFISIFFHLQILSGATAVRLGSTIFGARE